jgi:phosphatidylcholine synthase
MQRQPDLKVLAAFSVHVFTATGAAIALFALIAAVERRWTLMFVWLSLALVIDGADGFLARRLRVRDRVPRWSGDTLDLVVDILTYVFVPAYALVASDLLPQPVALPLGALIVLSSVIYFADSKMKTEDNYFVGFPAVWNVVACYLFILQLPQMWAAAIVTVLMIAAFVPVRFVHPGRVRRFAWANNLALAAAVLLTVVALAADLRPAWWVATGLCVVAAYFLAAGLVRTDKDSVTR